MAGGSGRRVGVLIGAGCAVVGMAGLAVACCGGGLFMGFNKMRDNEVVNGAVAMVEGDAAAMARLGSPLTVGWAVQGSMSVSGDEGTADLSLPLQGSLETATLSVSADRQQGTWVYQQVVLDFDQGHDRMTLVGD